MGTSCCVTSGAVVRFSELYPPSRGFVADAEAPGAGPQGSSSAGAGAGAVAPAAALVHICKAHHQLHTESFTADTQLGGRRCEGACYFVCAHLQGTPAFEKKVVQAVLLWSLPCSSREPTLDASIWQKVFKVSNTWLLASTLMT